MNRLKYLLMAIFLVCIFASISLGPRWYRHDIEEINHTKEINHKVNDKLTNDKIKVSVKENKTDRRNKVAETLDREVDTTDNKNKLKLVDIIGKELGDNEMIQKAISYSAETIVDTSGVSDAKLAELFYSQNISENIKNRISGKSYGENCNIPYGDLRYIRVLYIGFDKKTHIGELIVNKAIEKDILEIFKELYFMKYPIEKMLLVDEYDADDIKSMADDNSSAFNYRVVDSTTKLSIHSYGLAIDINPRYNPYVRHMEGKMVILPANGHEFADRDKDCEYYIHSGDCCYQAFTKRGFTWGGDWRNQKDYQHFEKEISE